MDKVRKYIVAGHQWSVITKSLKADWRCRSLPTQGISYIPSVSTAVFCPSKPVDNALIKIYYYIFNCQNRSVRKFSDFPIHMWD